MMTDGIFQTPGKQNPESLPCRQAGGIRNPEKVPIPDSRVPIPPNSVPIVLRHIPAKHLGSVIMLALSAILIFTGIQKTPAAYGSSPTRYPVLAACTRFEYNLFKEFDFSALFPPEIRRSPGDISAWKDQFHSTVDKVLDEHTAGTGSDCLASTHEQSFAPGPALKELALKLPSWRPLTWQLHNESLLANWWNIFNPNSTINWDTVNYNNIYLSRMDIGTVLLEYLRMYECALVERVLLLPSQTSKQETRRNSALGISTPWFLSLMMNINITETDRKIILEELLTARRAVHRTVVFLGGFNRLGLVNMEVKCLQESSLDLRNGLSLAATASSCMPRIFNQKDVLRDYRNE